MLRTIAEVVVLGRAVLVQAAVPETLVVGVVVPVVLTVHLGARMSVVGAAVTVRGGAVDVRDTAHHLVLQNALVRVLTVVATDVLDAAVVVPAGSIFNITEV